MKKALFLALLAGSLSTGTFAKSYHHKSYGHHTSHSKKSKKETCWRTNRHTGAKFKIC